MLLIGINYKDWLTCPKCNHSVFIIDGFRTVFNDLFLPFFMPFPLLCHHFFSLFVPLYRVFKPLLALPWPVPPYHISCNSCHFSCQSDRASSGYQAETIKIFWILIVIFLSFFFLAIQKWDNLFNLFRGLFLPQKKLTKRCVPHLRWNFSGTTLRPKKFCNSFLPRC